MVLKPKVILKIKKLEVDAVGFIHYPDSKRHVSLKQLKYLAKIVPDHIEKVVVVVNPQMSTIKRIINQTDINTIQLHGNESIQLIRNIKNLIQNKNHKSNSSKHKKFK